MITKAQAGQSQFCPSCNEQARLLGMGAERELSLLAKVDRLERELAAALEAFEALRSDVNRCYQILLTESSANIALFQAENILREALAIKPDGVVK